MSATMTERVCFTFDVRPEGIAEYRRLHDELWEDLEAAFRAAGRRQFSVFLREDGRAVGYYEADDAEASTRHLASQEIYQRWLKLMNPLVAGPSERLAEVYRLEQRDGSTTGHVEKTHDLGSGASR